VVGNRLVSAIVKVLTKPSQKGATWPYNDLESLKRHIRKGDVLLVEGNQRVSEVIKYLTQSIWSHAALYIGDELLREEHGCSAMVLRQFGEEAKHLIVEALLDEGVVASPLSKYIDSTIRVCRPHGLKPDALRIILGTVIGHLGDQYDTKHILDLARYFFPVNLIPRRFRKAALHLGSSIPTQVICSSLLADAFQKVRFPILPEPVSGESRPNSRRLSFREAIFGQGSANGGAVLRMPHPTFITARDFDLSPYFETINFNLIEAKRFSDRCLSWVDDQCSTLPQSPPIETRQSGLLMTLVRNRSSASGLCNQVIGLVGRRVRLWRRRLADVAGERLRDLTNHGNRSAAGTTAGKLCHLDRPRGRARS
jgi:hypothetical protein